MGMYDVNLKKTAIGYQFDRNVYIGYQTNDNRVVTFKDLKGYAGASSGGGGGGGGIKSVALTVEGQSIQLTVDDVPQPAQEVVVTKLSAATAPPTTALVCLVDEDGTVYKTTQTWASIQGLLTALAPLTNLTVSATDSTVTVGASRNRDLKINGTATKVSNPLTLTMGSQTQTYDGSAPITLSMGTIGTTAVSTLSIATPDAQSPSDNAIATVGYIKNSGLGSNVYCTEDDPSNPATSTADTRFIFVEVD